LTSDAPLRVDWLEGPLRGAAAGRLGLTILPGKHGPSSRYPGRVYRRDLAADIRALAEQGVARLVLLVEDRELQRWGEPAIVERATAFGVHVLRHPMPDGGTPSSLGEMDRILGEIDEGRTTGNVAVACMGGVGRSGLVAACALASAGMPPDEAIAQTRRVRHPEAVETAVQAAFVEAYAVHVAADGG
jgi:protein-tyrosine phosphatase